MPPRITVEFLGDSKNLEQAYRRTSAGATRFGRDVSRANALGAQSFDRLGRSATTATGRLGRLTTAFGGVGARSTYAGYRIQNVVTNIQSIGRESQSAAGSVNILVSALGLFGVIGAGVAGVALGLTKGAQGLTKLAVKAGVPGVSDKGVGAFQAALALQKRGRIAVAQGGVLGIADVAPAISQGFLDVAGLRTLKQRFLSQQQFRDAIALARENEKLRRQVPRRREVNPQQGRSTPQFVQPLTGAQQLKVSLANDPDNLAFLRQKITQDRAAIAFLTKRRAQNKISNEQFTAVYQAYYADINATTAQISAITAAAAKKTLDASRLRLPSNLSGTFGLNDLSAFRSGILPKGRVSGQFQKLLGSFEPPIGLRIGEARAEARGNEPALLSILKRERKSANDALKSGRLSALARIDAWNLIRDINDRIKDSAIGDVSNFRKASAGSFLKGVSGLSVTQRRALFANFSQVGPDGKVHGSGRGAFGFRDQQITVYLDGDKVESKVTKRQQTRRRRNPAQKRGPFTGGL